MEDNTPFEVVKQSNEFIPLKLVKKKTRTRTKKFLGIPIIWLVIFSIVIVVNAALLGMLWQYYTINITGNIDVTGHEEPPATLFYDDNPLNQSGNLTTITTMDYTVLNPGDEYTAMHHFDNIGDFYYDVTLDLSAMPLNYTDPFNLWYGLTIKAYEHGTTNELTTFTINPNSIYEFDLYYAVNPLFQDPEVLFPFNLQIDIECYEIPPTSIGPGDIIITEIMMNPAAVSDMYGEWFEIYNNASYSINMKGCNISDSIPNYFLITDDFIILPGEHKTFCNNDSFESNGGVICDYLYPYFPLANSGDEIIIKHGDTLIDQVIYDITWVVAGNSTQLSLDYYDHISNDNGDNWCQSIELLPGGDTGTPGTINNIC
jgi:hypothetical protein